MSSPTAASLSGDRQVGNASSLIPLLQANANEIDESGILPPEVLSAMDEADLFRLGLPAQFGGPGTTSLRTESDVLTELGKGNASAAWIVQQSSVISKLLSSGWPSEVVEEVHDSGHVGPAAAGSIFNPAHSQGVGRAVDGGFMISGRWSFSSGIRQAGWLCGGANLTDDTGAVRRAFVLIPRSDFDIADDWHVEGMKGTNSNTAYVSDEVFVPAIRTLPLGQFIEQVLPRALTVAIVGAPSIVLGCATAALDYFLGKAKRTSPFGAPYATLAEMPGVQITAGRVRADISLVEAVLQRGIDRADRATTGEIDLTPEDWALLRYEQVRGADLLRRAVEELQLAVGSSTAADIDKLGRYCRDIRVMCLHVFWRSDWVAEQFGRVLLGLEPWPPIFQDRTE